MQKNCSKTGDLLHFFSKFSSHSVVIKLIANCSGPVTILLKYMKFSSEHMIFCFIFCPDAFLYLSDILV